MEDIKNKILSFYQQLESDTNHRYKSWEHCFMYFSQNGIDERLACLHLSFYLASWGMYRGSSFLLWKDYLIHHEVVKRILSMQHLRHIDFSKECDAEIDKIFELSSWIRDWYQKNINNVNGEAKTVNVTDTLVTKILLGTLGCIPAYDRFFIDGLRKKELSHSKLSKNNFLSVVGFYKGNKDAFSYVQESIMRRSGICYPAMKLVDMYFWQIGFELYEMNNRV